jgi:hypothetical protein
MIAERTATPTIVSSSGFLDFTFTVFPHAQKAPEKNHSNESDYPDPSIIPADSVDERRRYRHKRD